MITSFSDDSPGFALNVNGARETCVESELIPGEGLSFVIIIPTRLE
jgi:hypothetical protein